MDTLEPKLQKPIGILGGTFDPIHNGHILPALDCVNALGLAKIKLLPLGVAVHKPQPIASAQQRIDMCQLVAQEHDVFEVDTREIERGGQSYSIITLEEMHAQWGANTPPLVWLMGQDAIEHFTQWKNWQGILKLAHIGVMRRGDYREQVLDPSLQPYQTDVIQGQAGCIVHIDTRAITLSSTCIRQVLHTEYEHNSAHSVEQVLTLMPESVRQYATGHHIYDKGC